LFLEIYIILIRNLYTYYRRRTLRKIKISEPIKDPIYATKLYNQQEIFFKINFAIPGLKKLFFEVYQKTEVKIFQILTNIKNFFQRELVNIKKFLQKKRVIFLLYFAKKTVYLVLLYTLYFK
jgi:hypothetical protein